MKTKSDSLQMTLETNQQYSMVLASEKGATSWLTALPLKRYGFDLTKTEFRDVTACLSSTALSQKMFP